MAIKEQVELELGKFRAQLAQSTSEMKSFRRTAEKDMEGFGSSMFRGLGDSLKGELHAGLGAIGATAGIVGGAQMFKGILEHYDNIGDTALKLNESTEVLQRVDAAAKLSGSSVEGVAGAFLKLEKNLGEVDNTKAAEALERFGLKVDDIISMPLDEKIIAFSEAFSRSRETGMGYADLLSLLGKNAAELIPLFAAGTDGIREMFAGAPVLADAEVQRLAALNDQFDKGVMKAKAYAAEVGSAWVQLSSFIAMTGAVGVDRALDWVGAQGQKDATDAVGREKSRKATGDALKESRDQIKADNDAKKAQEDAVKSAEKREKTVEKIGAMELAIARTNAELSGDSVEKFAALEKASAAIMAKKNGTGGSQFEDSAKGLQSWADALGKSGMVDEQQRVLELLKAELDLVKERNALNKQGFEEAAKEARAQYDELQKLKEANRKGEEKIMTPRQRLEAQKRDLDAVMGHVTNRKDLPGELDAMRKEAAAKEAAGDSESAIALRKKIGKAQDIMAEMAGTETPGKMAPPGSMAGALNRILGKGNDLAAEEGKRTNVILEKWDQVMKKLDTYISKDKDSNPQQSIWINSGVFTAP
jgi:hypothetical protein